MRGMKATLLALALVLPPGLVRAQAAAEGTRLTRTERTDQTLRDIEETLGLVPTYMKDFPREALPGAWASMKGLSLNPNTALDGRVKELIGLATAATIPCRYCSYFHNRAAKANGATEDQVREAVAKAALTGHWATYLASGLVDEAAYRRDVDRTFRHLERTARLPVETQPDLREAPAPGKLGQGTATGKTPPENVRILSSEETYKDIETTLGSTPVFLREYPKDSIPGIWHETKALEFGPDAALTKKEKALIGLAVSSRVKCDLCVYYQTKAARLHGATDDEMREAVAMAAVTQHWSTYLNGMRMDERQFMRETDDILERMKEKSSQPGK